MTIRNMVLECTHSCEKAFPESPPTTEKIEISGNFFSLYWSDVPSKKHQAASSQPAPLTKETEVVIVFATKPWVKYNYATSVRQCRNKHLQD